MSTNRLFTQYTNERQQARVEKLIIEAIRQYGTDIQYIPREFVTKDPIFGEDPLSQFTRVMEIEAYPEPSEGFSENPALMTKFGDFMKDEIRFTISKRRFEESRSENLLTESGVTLVTDQTNTYLHGNSSGVIELEDANQTYDNITQTRPNEGDLVWFPMVGRLFEIKYVTMEKMFYSLGKLNVYTLSCEIMDYSSEKIDTGIVEIDNVETDYTHDVLGLSHTAEDGVTLTTENGSAYIIDMIETDDPNDTFADNYEIGTEVNTFVEFSEDDPFSTGVNY